MVSSLYDARVNLVGLATCATTFFWHCLELFAFDDRLFFALAFRLGRNCLGLFASTISDSVLSSDVETILSGSNVFPSGLSNFRLLI